MKELQSITVPKDVQRADAAFFSALDAPFAIYGVFYEGGRFRRIPEALAKETNEGVFSLHANTAGGRLRFRTDSPFVILKADMPQVGKMPHFALTGSAGFDLYADNEFRRVFMPPFDIKDGFAATADLGSEQEREITVHFPLYSDVSALYIGLKKGALIAPPKPYRDVPKVVYYGSSITQGGCASRPGLAYQNILSRRLNADHLNLGFSGSAKGEPCMAKYIAGLKMSAFVLDYDHNAPTPEHLKETHAPFFETVRRSQPTLPIIMMTRPKFVLTEDEEKRLAIVRATFDAAKAAGDENVYLISGPELTAACGNEGTVDDCHPNDLGFASMAAALEPVLRKAIGI